MMKNINKEKILNLIQQIAYISVKGISITLVSGIGAVCWSSCNECPDNNHKLIPQKSKLWQLLDRLH